MKTRSKKPAVSVIIPTYNRGWMLKEAIDSVLAQDFTDFELIVVDDGSTDDTGQVLAAYDQKVIALHQSNRGVSAARNRGIGAASGQLIAFWIPMTSGCPANFQPRWIFFIPIPTP